ncbi:hypothetical protein [Bosea sp. (in: a-proteobacteria)]|uniref:hypothetical protein n=1 Tax=Bosea sp. (in: a-proteobacteria) TaxID=1871050 RepID=UPI0027365121|nr:hypothetical protein [Bosea sp. (in: a-proteobacteria)]MDP3408109.1 hypothetical protein [Bosea sp. (in: a-proteobacteria)]
MHLYLDIKTIPSQRPGIRDEIAATITPPGNISKAETIAAWEAEKKPALVDEAYAKTAYDGAAGHVVAIAYGIDDGNEATWCAKYMRPDWLVGSKQDMLSTEKVIMERAFVAMTDALQNAANAAEKHRLGPGRGFVYVRGGEIRDCQANVGPVTVVAHYADHVLRFLYQRAVILGVPVPRWFPINARANHNQPMGGAPLVVDTMTYWTGYGGRISLDRLCDTLGVKRETHIGDDQVYDRWLADDYDDVVLVARSNVMRLRQIHRKLTFWTPPPEQVVGPETVMQEALVHD